MKEENEIVEYKVGFWCKLRRKILSFFGKDTKENIIRTDFEKETTTEEKTKSEVMSKEEFMKIYNAVKDGSVPIEDLDKETFCRVMLLLNEEIDMVFKKVERNMDIINTEYNMLKA